MIYDCFPFFNELDLLELRLNELGDVVDKFVIVESPRTHSNREKPLFLKDNWKRFEPWHDKIIHRIVEHPADGDDPWARECQQRDLTVSDLDVHPDDILTLTDADEIPHPSVYQSFRCDISCLRMWGFSYYVNVAKDSNWKLARIVSGRWMADHAANHARYGVDPETLPIMWPGGWHFSWLGNINQLIEKCCSTSHFKDPTTASFMEKLRHDVDFDIRVGVAKCLTMNCQWPKAMMNNLDRWKKHILDPAEVERTAIQGLLVQS